MFSFFCRILAHKEEENPIRISFQGVEKMRKPVMVLAFALIVTLLAATPVFAAPQVFVDGQRLVSDVPPTIENGVTLVPLRAIFQALGAEVEWNGTTQTVTARKGGTTVMLIIGQKTAYKNGNPVDLQVPGRIVDGRTLVPLRFVSEALGAKVDWEGNTQTITITSLQSASDVIKVHFLDVGQADCIYIDLPANNDILIDGGNEADGLAVVNYLKEQGVDDIELLVATHPHEDHIGGLPAVYDAFSVERTIDSGKQAASNVFAEYLARAESEGIREEDNRQTFTYGNVVLQVLTAGEQWEDVNDYSVVTRLDCGDIEFLFTGDAEAPVESMLPAPVDAEILKVGHHGSDSSSSAAFLSMVKPEVAVISVGVGNPYGHPAKGTLERLQQAGAEIYRTDLNGNIVIETDGKTYSVITEKSGQDIAPGSGVVAPSAPAVPSETGEYVGSSKSDKYHYPDCRYAQKIAPENRVWFKDKAEAEAMGYEPCGVCKP